MKAKKSKDIQVHQGNTVGRDFIIGDIHGAQKGLQAIIEGLEPADRLYIVGDLTDRGEDSLGVIKTILANRARVFVAYGNHEELCLSTIICLEGLLINAPMYFEQGTLTLLTDRILRDMEKCSLKEIKATWSSTLIEDLGETVAVAYAIPLLEHIVKERGWLVRLFIKEANQGLIKLDPVSDTIQYEAESMVGVIQNFMENLPYIILVDGDDPFKVVHADMPFDDKTLRERISQDSDLTQEEKEYATWARLAFPGKKVDIAIKTWEGISEDAITYAGHSLLTQSKEPSVRLDTNTVNLDSKNFSTESFLTVNHTEGSSAFFKTPTEYPNLQAKNEVLNAFLQQRKKSQALNPKAGFFSDRILLAPKPVIAKQGPQPIANFK